MNRRTTLCLALALTAAAVAGWTGDARASDDFPWVKPFDPADTAVGLRSLKDRGTLWVGGEIRLAEFYARYNQGYTPTPARAAAVSPADFAANWNDRGRERHVSRFRTEIARLDFRVDASEQAALHLGLSLDDARDGVYGQDDFLDHAFFEFREFLGQPSLSLRAGKQLMPFGLHRDTLLVRPWTVAQPMDGCDGWFNNFNQTGNEVPGRLDKVFGLVADYGFLRDLARVEAGVFQNRSGRQNSNATHTDDDSVSSVLRLSLLPLEQLKLYASMANLHNTAGDDQPHGRANQQWYSVGLATKMFTLLPLEFFIEYQAGDGNNYLDGGRSHDLHTGLVWAFDVRWRLNLQGEWLRTRSQYLYASDPTAPSAGTTRQQTDLYRVLLAMEYDLAEHCTVEAGWQHEWMRAKYDALRLPGRGAAAVYDSGRGDLVYAGMKLRF